MGAGKDMMNKHVPSHPKYGDMETRLKRYNRKAPAGLTVKERLLFYSYVDRDTGCWEWTSTKNQKGYPRMKIDKVMCGAHRVSYEMFTGPLIDELEMDHICENRGCINPAHIQQISHGDNIRNGARWRHKKDNHCIHGHKYTEENTQIRADGRKRCATCRRSQARERTGIKRNAQDEMDSRTA